MLPEQPAGDSRHARRPSHKPPRRFLHVPFTVLEYETISLWAAAAGLTRSRYVREAALAIPILRRVSPRERLPHTTRAIACVRALARATMAAVDARTVYRLGRSELPDTFTSALWSTLYRPSLLFAERASNIVALCACHATSMS